MLDALQKQGWKVEHTEDGIIQVVGCFDDGFWSYIEIWPNAVFKQSFANDPAFVEKAELGDEAFIITSITMHRMTNPYNYHSLQGKASSLDEALQIAYEACQHVAERFDAFCDE